MYVNGKFNLIKTHHLIMEPSHFVCSACMWSTTNKLPKNWRQCGHTFHTIDYFHTVSQSKMTLKKKNLLEDILVLLVEVC